VTQKLRFLVQHPRFQASAANTVEVVVDGEGADDASAEDLIEIVREAAGGACRRAVGTHLVDAVSLSSRAALDHVGRLAAEASIGGVFLVGEQDRYAVLGRRPDGSEFVAEFSCVTQAEAEFRARWTMAAEKGAASCFDDFLDAMGRVEILRSHPGSISAEELRLALAKLVKEALAAGHSGPALNEGVALLGRTGFEPSVAPGPRP
jgi:hypothetical protein